MPALNRKAEPASAASRAVKGSGTKQLTSKAAAAGVKVRLVDINSTERNELITLPGVSNLEADKIIANRLFGSKVQLTTRGIRVAARGI